MAVETKALRSPVRFLLDSSPNLTEWLKRRLGSGRPTVYQPNTADDGAEICMPQRFAGISMAMAIERLGYGPGISGEDARQLILSWWRNWKSM